MNLGKLRAFCRELKDKQAYSIDPRDIKISQKITALLVPELIMLVEVALEMEDWEPSDCLRIMGYDNTGNLCICPLCIIKARANLIIK